MAVAVVGLLIVVPLVNVFYHALEKGLAAYWNNLTGNPDTMIKKIRYLHERCGIGHLLMMNQAGFMPADKVRKSMKLFAEEVYPAIKELWGSSTRERQHFPLHDPAGRRFDRMSRQTPCTSGRRRPPSPPRSWASESRQFLTFETHESAADLLRAI